jgi:hypothetical protein
VAILAVACENFQLHSLVSPHENAASHSNRTILQYDANLADSKTYLLSINKPGGVIRKFGFELESVRCNKPPDNLKYYKLASILISLMFSPARFLMRRGELIAAL